MSEYQSLNTHRWRALQYDRIAYNANSDTRKLYCLSDKQVFWLLSNTLYYSWVTRWQNLDNTEDLNAEQSELEHSLMNCVNLTPSQLNYIYQYVSKQYFDNLNAVYNGTPSSVNALTPDDFFNGDASQDRNRALCSACKLYVYSYAENWLNNARVTLGVSYVVGVASSVSIVGGIVASVILAGLTYVTNIAIDAMSDTSALDDIVCCMLSSLTGSAVNNANFQTSLDGCGFGVGTNSAIARDIIASDLTQFSNYLTFLDQLGNMYQLAQIGVYDCPCDIVTPFDVTYDFTVSEDGFTTRLVSVSVWSGAYDGWISSGYDFGSFKESGCKRTFNVIGELNTLVIDYYSLNAKGALTWQVTINGVNYPMPSGTGEQQYTINGLTNSGSFDISALMHFSDTLPNQSCRIRKIRLVGVGTIS